QIRTLKRGQHRKSLPHVFTEHGILMLSSVLNSKRAIQVNIEIMRTFVNLRRMLTTNAELTRKLDELEAKYDRQFKVVFDAIRQLMSPPHPDANKSAFVKCKEDAIESGNRLPMNTDRHRF